jgi:hypothetical protein
MNLPNNEPRCHGQTVYEVCSQRETCRRFLEAKLGQPHAWMAAQVPGPCDYYLERREAPGEGLPRTGSTSPNSPSPSNPGDPL